MTRIKKDCFIISYISSLRAIGFADIIKFERFSRKNVALLTRENEYVISESLDRIYEKLDKKRFIFANRNNIVNLSYVNGINNRDMELYQCGNLRISRRRIQQIKQAVSNYYKNNN